MTEQIYTIPINEAFDRALSSDTVQCPFCLLDEMLDKNEVERVLGAAMMEPDVRIETNRLGFCREHFDKMYEKGNRLGLGLILESHIAEVEKQIFSGGTLFDPQGKKEEEKLSTLERSCYICERKKDALSKMLGTTVYLFDTEEDFREKYKKQKCFCISHYRDILVCGRNRLDKKRFKEFFEATRGIMQNYIKTLGGDISWFCKKFDYRFDSEPWYNSRDSIPRAMNFLSGGVNSEE